MTADNEDKIREIISNAEPVQDPLKELVQKTESDPGAPFEPENIELLAELRGMTLPSILDCATSSKNITCR